LFNEHIFLNNISFQYGINAPVVLNQISLTVPKGARLGLIGTTGSGKSTLLDILMGLLSPTHGTFEVDRQVITDANVSAWQRRVAHVPQSVFLADASILENIALGVPLNQIDVQRAHAAVEMAQLADTINILPLGYQTTVGERGSRLSGGQRQRIGIARALYKGVDVLILDEATSALDLETERAVMEGVNRLPADLTVIIVAHRLSTLSGCSEIMEINEGKLQRVELG
jgi:ATP-binding cassette subfamily B protein